MRLALATGVALTSPALSWAQSSPTQGNPIDTLPKVDTSRPPEQKIQVQVQRPNPALENLLATPVHPLEVMTGKIVPYISIGLVQVTIILLMAFFVFHVPFVGSVWMVYVSALLFIVASLTVGITLSSLAQNQLQATQLTFFYFLPNILLSGFMFPFVGMPKWAQVIGNLLPMTYFNRLTRGILLKGNGWFELWPSIWPLMVFTVVVLGVALRFYRKTLD